MKKIWFVLAILTAALTARAQNHFTQNVVTPVNQVIPAEGILNKLMLWAAPNLNFNVTWTSPTTASVNGPRIGILINIDASIGYVVSMGGTHTLGAQLALEPAGTGTFALVLNITTTDKRSNAVVTGKTIIGTLSYSNPGVVVPIQKAFPTTLGGVGNGGDTLSGTNQNPTVTGSVYFPIVSISTPPNQPPPGSVTIGPVFYFSVPNSSGG